MRVLPVSTNKDSLVFSKVTVDVQWVRKLGSCLLQLQHLIPVFHAAAARRSSVGNYLRESLTETRKEAFSSTNYGGASAMRRRSGRGRFLGGRARPAIDTDFSGDRRLHRR
jgi:hypothetical protein